MKNHQLHATSPLDGRYYGKTGSVRQYFSEFALIRYRTLVEIEYLLFLLNILRKDLPNDMRGDELRRMFVRNFEEEDAARIKEIERTTNHDVKAVEVWLGKEFVKRDLGDLVPFIHFGLTSFDVNHTAQPLQIKDFTENDLLPELYALKDELQVMSGNYQHTAMLAHTHGQPASPTTLGKEIFVFHERIKREIKKLEDFEYTAKFGGASGNMNAHDVAFPKMNWPNALNQFISDLGLKREGVTTQISSYDNFSEWCQVITRICVILTDMSRDFWTYISVGYFIQEAKEGEVGSSAMPHKVNPIDFENAEGNLGMAVALLQHFSQKLPISRLQRDLSDSTVTRNIGVPLGHLLIAVGALRKGLGKLSTNETRIAEDLSNNQQVVAEGIQTILRREGVPDAYDQLKDLTRGQQQVTRDILDKFIDSLSVSEKVKKEMKNITPETYIGYADELGG